MPVLFQNTSVTLSEAKSVIASASNAQNDTDFRANANNSLRAAFRKWNRAADWDWTRVVHSDITVTGGTATYALPYNVKSIYDVRLDNRSLSFANRRIYDRLTVDQSASRSVAYDLFRKGSQGYIELLPPPSENGTLTIKYHRLLTEPCFTTASGLSFASGSGDITCTTILGLALGAPITFSAGFAASTTITAINSATSFSVAATSSASGTNVNATAGGDTVPLDIPTQFVDGVLAEATHHYLANTAGSFDSPRLQYWYTQADKVLQEAVKNNNNNPDQEIVFVPSYVADSPLYSDNPVIQDWVNW